MVPWNRFRHGQRRLPLSRVCGLGHPAIDHQPMAVLHQHVPKVTQFGLLAKPGQHRLIRTFGEGCRNAYMIRAVMQLSHFLGCPSKHFFTSMS